LITIKINSRSAEPRGSITRLMAVDTDFRREAVVAKVYTTILPQESCNAFFNSHFESTSRLLLS
jgi:hypothetical protein